MSEIPETPASDFEYTAENGDVTITKYIGSDAQVRIPEKIEGKPVTEIGEHAFSECSSLTSVTIPDSVTEIGEYAFGYTYKYINYNKISDFTIYGKAGSAAETYANDNGFKFVTD